MNARISIVAEFMALVVICSGIGFWMMVEVAK